MENQVESDVISGETIQVGQHNAEDKRLKQGQHNNWIKQLVTNALKECGETADVQPSNFSGGYFVTWRNASSLLS